MLLRGEGEGVVLSVPNQSYIGYCWPKVLAFDLDGVPRDSEGVGDVHNRG